MLEGGDMSECPVASALLDFVFIDRQSEVCEVLLGDGGGIPKVLGE